jgi:hypothetical protein
MEEALIKIYSGFYNPKVYHENIRFFIEIQKDLLSKCAKINL